VVFITSGLLILSFIPIDTGPSFFMMTIVIEFIFRNQVQFSFLIITCMLLSL
jgi:hypothetical protein